MFMPRNNRKKTIKTSAELRELLTTLSPDAVSILKDVMFDDKLPEINHALTVHVDPKDNNNVGIHLTLEVSLHLGNNVVRTIAMDGTDGVVRGMDVIDTEAPISVPVGKETLGRIFNVLC